MHFAVLLFALSANVNPTPPPDRITFMRSGRVWVIDADGTSEQAITDTLRYSADRPLTWSPDGRRVLFWSHSPIGWDIWSMSADGTDPKNLTRTPSGGCRSPAFSPDGKRIAFLRDDPEGLYLMDADGSNPRRLTDRAFRDGTPSWSPDGRQIAYTRDEGDGNAVYCHDLAAGTDRRVARGARDPLWSPDGRRLLFVASRAGGQNLVTVAPDGAGEVVLTEGAGHAIDPVWSPEGKSVAYFVVTGGSAELRVVEVGTKTVRHIAAGQDRGWQVSWSPDGQWLVYSLGAPGKQVVSIADAAGRSVRSLAAGGACFPAWQPRPSR